MSNAGHPKNFSYARCVNCICWRPLAALQQLPEPMKVWNALAGELEVVKYECRDAALCQRLAEGPTNAPAS